MAVQVRREPHDDAQVLHVPDLYGSSAALPWPEQVTLLFGGSIYRRMLLTAAPSAISAWMFSSVGSLTKNSWPTAPSALSECPPPPSYFLLRPETWKKTARLRVVPQVRVPARQRRLLRQLRDRFGLHRERHGLASDPGPPHVHDSTLLGAVRRRQTQR